MTPKETLHKHFLISLMKPRITRPSFVISRVFQFLFPTQIDSGVNDLYTDPQIHSEENMEFGKGNLGAHGIEKFLSSHRCNAICRYLKLPKINAKLKDVGTLPAQPVMKYAHVDVLNVQFFANENNGLLKTSNEEERQKLIPSHQVLFQML